MKKRLAAAFLAAAMAVTSLTACGGSETETTAAAAAATEAAAEAEEGAETEAAGEEAAAATEGETYTLRYAELNPDGHIMDECGDYFAQLVNEKSGGRITIEVFLAGQCRRLAGGPDRNDSGDAAGNLLIDDAPQCGIVHLSAVEGSDQRGVDAFQMNHFIRSKSIVLKSSRFRHPLLIRIRRDSSIDLT